MAKYRKGTFSEIIHNKMLGKGWFKVKDILNDYIKFRGNINIYQKRYMSGDASWRLMKMVDFGLLIRKPDENHKMHYLYKVNESDK